MTHTIEARKVTAGYGGVPVLRDVDLHVKPGEVVALLGANGAGKTTTLRALMGAIEVMSGEVAWNGAPTHLPMHKRSRAGMSYVPEERSVIMSLTAADNLKLGGGSLETAVALFPELEPHLKRRAGLLSGGQQQMVALGRALSRGPRCLLADELSLGLAPIIVDRLLSAVRTAADSGLSVLLVEQHAAKALAVADRAYLLVRGRIEEESSASSMASRMADLESRYLGGPSLGDSRPSAGRPGVSSGPRPERAATVPSERKN